MTIKRVTSALIASLLAFALLTFTMADASAKQTKQQGGAKVDSDSYCTDVDREDNTITLGSQATIWLNVGSSGIVPDTQYSYQIFDRGQSVTGVTPLDFDPCLAPNDNYYEAQFTAVAPNGPGSYTLVVYDAAGDIVSHDSFRVI